MQPKPTVALIVGAVLIFGALSQTAQAQSVIDTNYVVLADAAGSAASPTALPVSTWVTQLGNVYTYNYIVYNPAGDTGKLVTTFSVGFESDIPGVVSSISGDGVNNAGNLGVLWQPLINSASGNFLSAGAQSAVLSFQSDEPPTIGAANSNGSSPPGPWKSINGGEDVFVPVPEPEIMSMLAGALLLLPFRSSVLKKSRS